MNTMNKQFEHRGYNFNIKVELNTRVERGMNGDRYHTITVNCMDKDNYYVKEEVNDKHLTLYIHSAIIVAQKYVDEKIDGVSTADKRLTELGFK